MNDMATNNGSEYPVYRQPAADSGITAEFVRNFGSAWERAWNSHDTDSVLALLHPEIRWNDTVFWPSVINGRDEMRAYVDKIWSAMPGVFFEEVQLFTAIEAGRALYLFKQTAKSPPSFNTDKTSITYGCDIFLGFRNGLLSDYMAQYEITDMLRQLGVLPPRNGRSGGAYLLSLTN